MNIAVLMTVHNRRDTTLRCLEALYNQNIEPTDIRFEVFLTDDGCTDGTPDAIRQRFPDVNIIAGDGTLYWNGGMHKAWEEASKKDFDFFFWLNDDTILYPDALTRVVENSSGYGHRSVVVGATCSPSDKSVITYGGWDADGLQRQAQVPVKCSTMNGNVVLVPKYVFEILGMNTTIFTHQGGDWDYACRANAAGIGVWTVIGIVGECAAHCALPIWKDPKQPIGRRLSNYFSPIGAEPFAYFKWRYQQKGLFPACFTLISSFIHTLFPSLWRR